MASIEMKADLSSLVDALVAGDNNAIVVAARDLLAHGESADVLIGRIGLIAAHGDPTGHTLPMLNAAAMLCRYIHTIPQPLEGTEQRSERALPLFAQAMLAAAPAVRAGQNAHYTYPEPFFPSGLGEKGSVNDAMHQAVQSDDVERVERLLFGLYGTGADYRTLEVRAYESIATTFQDAGRPFMLAARGFQLLDTVEWGDRTPHIIHWLAPHLPLRPDAAVPEWVRVVSAFAAEPAHDMSGIRTRISIPKNQNALPLQQLLLSDADTTQVCQAVYDTVMQGEASSRAVSSVIALAAAEVMNLVGDGDRALFVRVAQGLLFASAIRLAFQQVQDVEVLPLLFTSAAFVNALRKEIVAQNNTVNPIQASASAVLGGGLIAPAQLDTLKAQLEGRDLASALATAQRYMKLDYDTRALFAVIGLVAAQTNASLDQGYTLQIVQAASEEFLAWPHTLGNTNIEIYLQIAIRAAAFGERGNSNGFC
ncbi:MAG: hypothetical protein NVSMB38_00720 [Ktedonobacteraceae bacterium]